MSGTLESLPRVNLGIIVGCSLVLLFFGGLGIWAAQAPLNSAAIASGVVAVDIKKKIIQHFEGGIIDAILVKDGQEIEAGQVLVRLDQTAPLAELKILKSKLLGFEALQARLLAQRDGRKTIEFLTKIISQMSDPVISRITEGERSIFKTQQEAVAGERKSQKQLIRQIHEEIKGINGQIRADKRQHALLNLEIKDVGKLVGQGLSRKTRLRELQRRSAAVEGNQARNNAEIAKARQRIEEARTKLAKAKMARLTEVVLQLRKVQENIFNITERVRTAKDVLTRTEIRAPLPGVVVDLKVHTVGGVVAAGTPLMEILPSGRQFVVDAKVDPKDIDTVHAGLPVEVRLTAFSLKNMSPIRGKVKSVSADRLTDKLTRRPYYRAIIKFTDELDPNYRYAGMSAEVLIVTGTQSTLEYIIGPIATTLHRAFREE